MWDKGLVLGVGCKEQGHGTSRDIRHDTPGQRSEDNEECRDHEASQEERYQEEGLRFSKQVLFTFVSEVALIFDPIPF